MTALPPELEPPLKCDVLPVRESNPSSRYCPIYCTITDIVYRHSSIWFSSFLWWNPEQNESHPHHYPYRSTQSMYSDSFSAFWYSLLYVTITWQLMLLYGMYSFFKSFECLPAIDCKPIFKTESWAITGKSYREGSQTVWGRFPTFLTSHLVFCDRKAGRRLSTAPYYYVMSANSTGETVAGTLSCALSHLTNRNTNSPQNQCTNKCNS